MKKGNYSLIIIPHPDPLNLIYIHKLCMLPSCEGSGEFGAKGINLNYIHTLSMLPSCEGSGEFGAVGLNLNYIHTLCMLLSGEGSGEFGDIGLILNYIHISCMLPSCEGSGEFAQCANSPEPLLLGSAISIKISLLLDSAMLDSAIRINIS